MPCWGEGLSKKPRNWGISDSSSALCVASRWSGVMSGSADEPDWRNLGLWGPKKSEGTRPIKLIWLDLMWHPRASSGDVAHFIQITTYRPGKQSESMTSHALLAILLVGSGTSSVWGYNTSCDIARITITWQFSPNKLALSCGTVQVTHFLPLCEHI